MEKHDIQYYLNIRSINAGMGIEYNMEHHIMEDNIARKYYEEKYMFLQKQEEIKNKTKYIFLTINPNAQVDFKEFMRVIIKMMSKNYDANEKDGEIL